METLDLEYWWAGILLYLDTLSSEMIGFLLRFLNTESQFVMYWIEINFPNFDCVQIRILYPSRKCKTIFINLYSIYDTNKDASFNLKIIIPSQNKWCQKNIRITFSKPTWENWSTKRNNKIKLKIIKSCLVSGHQMISQPGLVTTWHLYLCQCLVTLLTSCLDDDHVSPNHVTSLFLSLCHHVIISHLAWTIVFVWMSHNND